METIQEWVEHFERLADEPCPNCTRPVGSHTPLEMWAHMVEVWTSVTALFGDLLKEPA